MAGPHRSAMMAPELLEEAMSRPQRVLSSWLQHEASRSADPGALLVDLCQRLAEADVPLRRAALTVSALHPLVTGSTFTWRRDRPDALEMPRFHGMPGALHEPADARDELDLTIAFSDGVRHRLASRAIGRMGSIGRRARCCDASPACWRCRSRPWSPGRLRQPCSRPISAAAAARASWPAPSSAATARPSTRCSGTPTFAASPHCRKACRATA